MTLEDLPAIEDLQITVDESQCIEIGIITTVVDQLGKVQLSFSGDNLIL